MESVYIIRQIVISAVPILLAIILHEISHGFIANELGDPTAKMMGRLTLNPIAHIDLFGTILMPIMLFVFTNGQFVFGYAKPVPINPYNFKNPKRDMALSAAGGPLTNILIAFICAVFLKYAVIPGSVFVSEEMAGRIMKPLVMMLTASININIILAAFNLLPVPPLDGGRVMMGLLPHRQAEALGRIEPFGMIIILVLVATGVSRYFILPLISVFYNLIGLV